MFHGGVAGVPSLSLPSSSHGGIVLDDREEPLVRLLGRRLDRARRLHLELGRVGGQVGREVDGVGEVVGHRDGRGEGRRRRGRRRHVRVAAAAPRLLRRHLLKRLLGNHVHGLVVSARKAGPEVLLVLRQAVAYGVLQVLADLHPGRVVAGSVVALVFGVARGQVLTGRRCWNLGDDQQFVDVVVGHFVIILVVRPTHKRTQLLLETNFN